MLTVSSQHNNKNILTNKKIECIVKIHKFLQDRKNKKKIRLQFFSNMLKPGMCITQSQSYLLNVIKTHLKSDYCCLYCQVSSRVIFACASTKLKPKGHPMNQ